MKVLIVCGTRPEAIKLAPLVQELEKHPKIECRICATGQHREMLRQVLDFFGIQPHHDLDLMQTAQDLTGLTARLLDALRFVLAAERPDIVVVQGDTATAFAAALASFYARIPVAHVEAGLRTLDLSAPFPEEGLRQLTARLAAVHFAPTTANMRALLREGIPPDRIQITGNTVIDALLWARNKVRPLGRSALRPYMTHQQFISFEQARRIIMVTAHRRESFGAGLRQICTAIATLAASEPGVLFVYPVHPNPNVACAAEQYLSHCPNVLRIRPLDYPALVSLMEASYFIITDSGGIQEEAPSLGKPVLVLREVTERQEALDTGQVRLVGTDPASIIAAARELLTSEEAYRRMISSINPYGDGRAASRIASALTAYAHPPLRPAVLSASH